MYVRTVKVPSSNGSFNEYLRVVEAYREEGKVKSRERIAVLAALNLAYEASNQGSASAAPASTASEPSPDIEALIRRLDRALSNDGQLL